MAAWILGLSFSVLLFTACADDSDEVFENVVVNEEATDQGGSTTSNAPPQGS